MDYESIAVSAIADYQAANGLNASGDLSEASSKLSDLIGKLRGLGINWQTIFGLISLIMPMITSGKIDWAAVWAAIQVLIPNPKPNPGPMNP